MDDSGLEMEAKPSIEPGSPRGNDVSKYMADLEDNVNRRVLGKEAVSDDNKLGTFKGVFVPTLQNILGVIIFLRLPWITGQAGILQALGVVLISCMATVLTSLSMSAVATNGIPQGGGCFAIIKEALGPEFGGTVGILLFLSNTFGVAMYVLGAVEVLQIISPMAADIPVRILGAAVLFSLAFIVYVGISYIIKFAILFLCGVLLAIFSIFFGVFAHSMGFAGREECADDDTVDACVTGLTSKTFGDNIGPDYGEDPEGNAYSFAAVLAIFFPAVTDPLAGSNLSGDLKDPQGSIPPGTLAAVITTTFVFCAQVMLSGASTQRPILKNLNAIVVVRLAWPFPEVVYAGILLSTLGAGLQSLAGAPRLLAAIGRDRLLPQLVPFAPPPGSEPRKALALIFTLSMGCVMLGDLNAVAPFITMWFLTCYAIINFATAVLGFEQAPSFRPKWRYYDWRLSALGAVQCAGMMFFIDPVTAFCALLIAAFIYQYIRYTLAHADVASDGHPNGGVSSRRMVDRIDWRSGIRFQQARSALLALEDGDFSFKYWRPFFLFCCKLSSEDGAYVPQAGMIHLIAQLMQRGKGLAIVGGVIEGEYEDHAELAEIAREKLRNKLADIKMVEGFPEVVVARSEIEGHLLLVQCKGLGVLRPNIVLAGWPKNINATTAQEFSRFCRNVSLSGKTLVLCKANAESQFPDKTERMGGCIDVWWIFDLFPAKGLLLLLPYLLQQSAVWAKTKLRLFAVATPDTDEVHLQQLLERAIGSGGLKVEVKVIKLDVEEAPRFAYNTAQKVKKGGAADVNPMMSKGASGDAPASSTTAPAASHGTTDPLESRRSSITMDAFGSKVTSLLTRESGDSPLVIITLPQRPPDQDGATWMRSVETLALPLQRIIFVQESGREKFRFGRASITVDTAPGPMTLPR